MGRVGASQGEGEETDRVFVRVASPEEWRAREEESREVEGWRRVEAYVPGEEA